MTVGYKLILICYATKKITLFFGQWWHVANRPVYRFISIDPIISINWYVTSNENSETEINIFASKKFRAIQFKVSWVFTYSYSIVPQVATFGECYVSENAGIHLSLHLTIFCHELNATRCVECTRAKNDVYNSIDKNSHHNEFSLYLKKDVSIRV